MYKIVTSYLITIVDWIDNNLISIENSIAITFVPICFDFQCFLYRPFNSYCKVLDKKLRIIPKYEFLYLPVQLSLPGLFIHPKTTSLVPT
jgi:hypothetical protein